MSRDRPTVCVIGAGAVGLGVAWRLLERQLADVVVVDARHVAAGSSALSLGIIETQYIDHLDIELRVAATPLFAQLEGNGLDITRNGYLRLGRTDAEAELFVGSASYQRELGVADVGVLEPKDIARFFPDLRTDDLRAGLFGQQDGFVDGALLCGLLAEQVERLGGTVRARTALQAGERTSAGWRLRVSRGESVECDLVVNAAGAWAPDIAARLGYGIEQTGLRAQAVVVHLDRALSYRMPSVMDWTPLTEGDGLVIRHERPEQLVASMHGPDLQRVEDPDGAPSNVSAEFIALIAGQLAWRLPELGEEARIGSGWSGLYPTAADEQPRIGPAVTDGTILNAVGLGAVGIQLSPVVGELVGDWIEHGRPKVVAGAKRLAPMLAES